MKDKFIIYRVGANQEKESPYQLVEAAHFLRKNYLFIRHAGKLWPVVKINNKYIGRKPLFTIDDLEQGCIVYALPKIKALGKTAIHIGPLDIKTIERVDYFHDEIHTKEVFRITTEGNKDPITLIHAKHQLFVEMEEGNHRHQYPIIGAKSAMSSVRGMVHETSWLKPGTLLTFQIGGTFSHHNGTLPPIKTVRKLTPTEALIEQGGL
ncbi:hypothetical protein KY362_07200 [Candidatus Woesearchaeota archaeon]|nr:hypothetical protein [Candidatus Woesearchaeota archaeon]